MHSSHDSDVNFDGSYAADIFDGLPTASSSKKRKRDTHPTEEIEVNISAPEPPSKKALRKAKKSKLPRSSSPTKPVAQATKSDSSPDHVNKEEPTRRSEHGIWIGNLPFTATKAHLRKFLTDNTDIAEETITRLHMPAPANTKSPASRQKNKPQNKGFAYVDFSSSAALDEALALSEKLLLGRRVLIKNSKSFEGRPEKPKDGDPEALASKSGKPPSKRIFIGNLGFDTSKEDLQEHFAPCGEILDVHIATFEDSGKCKGYAWVEFDNVEAGEAAVRGWAKLPMKVNDKSDSGDDEGDSGSEKASKKTKPQAVPKLRKWWVNKIKGRPLRMEFAEDKAVRYKKRFGKEATAAKEPGADEDYASPVDSAGSPKEPPQPATVGSVHRKGAAVPRSRRPREIDARNVKPGAALANAQRLTGAIVAGKGKKTTFN
ncbi:MAG: hypothetical protein M1830_000122 [Pleopsidium flavum]|nr:MAG: hypothetical protein M1830_000122 [Pleopsidium flavum]